MFIEKQRFGALDDGTEVSLYTLTNDGGMTVQITDFGGAVVRILTPDRRGHIDDVVAGYDSLADYAHADGYLGALVGRVGNRIAKGCFELDGAVYDRLVINNGENHLHGGAHGMSFVVWHVESAAADDQSARLVLTHESPDGDEGYPGHVRVKVTYSLDASGALGIHYEAETDKATPFNMTNHTYFNLGGFASGDVFDQVLWLDAESYLPTDAGLIPTGVMADVHGTPFDFTTEKPIGQDFDLANPDLCTAGGYDHCFNFTDWAALTPGCEPVKRAEVYDPASGRCLEMLTNQPCVQFYSANFLKNPDFPLKGGYPQKPQHAFCLETQKMPDSIHHQGDPRFTDCVLQPGMKYDYTTIYRFSAR